jgi:hypothetical protein
MTRAAVARRFHTGQQVRFSGGYPYRDAAGGFYEVLAQLPYCEGEFQYRIKSPQEQYERVVKESELDAY